MTDLEKIASLEKRVEELERIIKMLSANDEEEVIKLSLSSAPSVFRCDFTDEFILEKSNWILVNGNVIPDKSCLAFEIDPTADKEDFADPRLRIDGLNIDSNHAKYLHLKFKSDVDVSAQKGWYNNNVYYNALAQFYFKTSADNRWSQSKSITCYYRSGEVVDKYIKINHSMWNGEIISIRFDPSEKLLGKAEIYLIELLDDMPAAGLCGYLKGISTKLSILEEKVDDIEEKIDDII